MSDNKYNLLVHVLDKIAEKAPENLSIYHPEQGDTDAEIHKRSRSFIHLFLKVRFGILDFGVSESQITDGTNDGGLDAYHIDEEEKKIYLIQSKFSATLENFETNPVNGYEFFRMELNRIISDGENTSRNGNGYNGKIIDFQEKLQNIPSLNRYEYVLIYLGNVSSRIDGDQLLQVSGNVCDVVEIINGETFYKDVLMPYLQHDFFNQKDFVLKIQVHRNQSNRITYGVDLGNEFRAGVELAFVPTKEIAKMMSQYRNSLLRYNPRCYVGLTRGGVNHAIQESMENTDLNEFSLLNNGITVICNDFSYSDRNAEPGVATLLVTNPQIVNGGQTAFTLAHLFENSDENDHFSNKEVLVKFITLPDGENMIDVIEKISKATNNQTPVSMADRKSNDENLVQLQNYLFNIHGLLLERKRGQFYDAVQNGLVDKNSIISSELLMRLLLVYRGDVARARSSGAETMFRNYSLDEVDYDALYLLIKIYRKIELEENRNRGVSQRNRYRMDEWGNGLRYGKYAITYFVHKLLSGEDSQIDEKINVTREKWNDFETTASNDPRNENYNVDGFDFANYYKGSTVNDELNEYLEQM
jgi:hypothetical protein